MEKEGEKAQNKFKKQLTSQIKKDQGKRLISWSFLKWLLRLFVRKIYKRLEFKTTYWRKKTKTIRINFSRKKLTYMNFFELIKLIL